MATLFFDVRALKAANRQWNNLSPELTREIGKLKFVHPAAILIKDLEFYYLLQNAWCKQPLVVRYKSKALGYIKIRCKPSIFILNMNSMLFGMMDIPYPREIDRFQRDSDRASGFRLGRVARS